MTFATETLAGLGIRLAGVLIVATNTDEESSGAGGMALVRRGLKADAAIVTEASNHTTWVACRGSEYGTITVPGRPGHAEVRQPHWREGGAVNAIEEAIPVLAALRSLRREWAERDGLDHPYLSRPDLLPTMARAGEWAVTYPASCDLTIAVMYVMAQADEHGWGSKVREEVERHVLEAVKSDEWLAEHPPVFRWWDNPVMPLDIDPDLPIVKTMLETTADAGGPAQLSGLDSWYDGATLTLYGGFPAISYGPPGFDQNGLSLAHMIDEYVPVDGLVRCAQDLAVAAMRFCGLAD
jgi:acetylornithine deacetylase